MEKEEALELIYVQSFIYSVLTKYPVLQIMCQLGNEYAMITQAAI